MNNRVLKFIAKDYLINAAFKRRKAVVGAGENRL
jgi:hypothetical protein